MRCCTAAVCNCRRTWSKAKHGQQPLQQAIRPPPLLLLLLWLLHVLLLLAAACAA
jgi:hypothetical protein